MFRDIKLTNLEISTSDHCLIFLKPKRVVHVTTTKVIRFENAWLQDPMCHQIVEEVWHQHQGCSMRVKLK